METLGLMDKTLYDITENELLDVWDTDFATVRNNEPHTGKYRHTDTEHLIRIEHLFVSKFKS